MRIISPFRDYYDCISGMTYNEDDIVYYRTERTIKEKVDLPRPGKRKFYFESLDFGIKEILGFCGKLYYRYYVRNPKTHQNVYSFSDIEIDKYIKDYYSDKHYQQFCGQKTKHYKDRLFRSFTKDEITSSLRHPPEHTQIFEQYKCPMFSYSSRYSELTLNPRLNRINFQCIFDPYQAYQEISMFLGNMAFPNKPIPTVSDEDMIQAKGFDKFSFRKDPKGER